MTKYTNTSRETLNFVVDGRENGVQATESIAPGETKTLSVAKDHQHWLKAHVDAGNLMEGGTSKAEAGDTATRRKATSE